MELVSFELTRTDIDSIDWHVFSKMVTVETIVKTRDRLPWDWDAVSSSVTIDCVLAGRELPWNWSVLSSSVNIKLCDITANLDLPWDWSEIPERHDITRAIVYADSSSAWSWRVLYMISYIEN